MVRDAGKSRHRSPTPPAADVNGWDEGRAARRTWWSWFGAGVAGDSPRRIAQGLGLSRNTVRGYVPVAEAAGVTCEQGWGSEEWAAFVRERCAETESAAAWAVCWGGVARYRDEIARQVAENRVVTAWQARPSEPALTRAVRPPGGRGQCRHDRSPRPRAPMPLSRPQDTPDPLSICRRRRGLLVDWCHDPYRKGHPNAADMHRAAAACIVPALRGGVLQLAVLPAPTGAPPGGCAVDALGARGPVPVPRGTRGSGSGNGGGACSGRRRHHGSRNAPRAPRHPSGGPPFTEAGVSRLIRIPRNPASARNVMARKHGSSGLVSEEPADPRDQEGEGGAGPQCGPGAGGGRRRQGCPAGALSTASGPWGAAGCTGRCPG